MIQFLSEHLISLLGFLFGSGGILLWFLEKQKYNETIAGMKAENENKEIDNDSKIISLYQKSLDDLHTRYELKFKDLVDTYDRKIKLMNEEIELQSRIITSLKRENQDLKNTIKILENEKNIHTT